MIEPGVTAPDFTLPDQDGNPVSLSRLRAASAVVLYFYPKADTPGCTTQACGVRDHLADYEARRRRRARRLARPGQARQEVRTTSSDLDFTLLADEDHAVCEAYGVWVEKSMYGTTYWGAAARDVRDRRRGHRRARDPEGHAEDARRRGAGRPCGQHHFAYLLVVADEDVGGDVLHAQVARDRDA